MTAPDRRSFLRALGVTVTGASAGCDGPELDGSGTETDSGTATPRPTTGARNGSDETIRGTSTERQSPSADGATRSERRYAIGRDVTDVYDAVAVDGRWVVAGAGQLQDWIATLE